MKQTFQKGSDSTTLANGNWFYLLPNDFFLIKNSRNGTAIQMVLVNKTYSALFGNQSANPTSTGNISSEMNASTSSTISNGG